MRGELESVLAAAQGWPREELPALVGALAEAQAVALARLATPAPAQTQPDELLNVEEASRRLGVGPDYLYRHHRKLPFTRRVGRKLLFSSLGVAQYIRQRR